MQTTAAIIHSNKCGWWFNLCFWKGSHVEEQCRKSCCCCLHCCWQSASHQGGKEEQVGCCSQRVSSHVSGMQWSPEASSLLALGAVT